MIENLPIKIGVYTSGLYRLMSSALDKSFTEKGIPLTRSIKSLEEKGFLIKASNENDKRYKKLIITEVGQAALAEIIAVEQATVNIAINNFSIAEKEQFEHLLLKAKENLMNEYKIQHHEE